MRIFLLTFLLLTGTLFASPPSPLKNKVNDNELYIHFNSSNDKSVSLTQWLTDNVNGLIQHVPFQQKVETLIIELFDNPATPWVEPVLDIPFELPLFGDINLGIHIQDIWNTGTGANQYPVGGFAADAIGDTDTVALDIDWANVSVAINPYWAMLGDNQELPEINNPLKLHDGAIELLVDIGQVDVDVFLRKPDFPIHITSSSYIHALGKVRFENVRLAVTVWSIGGQLQAPFGGGYGIGLDIANIELMGHVIADLEDFDCGYTGATTDGILWQDGSRGMCFVYSNGDWYLDPTHPDRVSGVNVNDTQTAHTNRTNEISDFLSEVIQFIEGVIYLNAEEFTSGAVTNYLTGLEITDTTWFTHRRNAAGIQDVWKLNHPFDTTMQVGLDYGFMYRMGVYQSSVLINGGMDIEAVTYDRACNGGVGSPWLIAPPKLKKQVLGEAPMFSLGIHQNVFNNFVNSLYETGVCFGISKNTPLFGDVLGQWLEVSNFKNLFPNIIADTGSIMIKVDTSFLGPDGMYNPVDDQPRVEFSDGDPLELFNPDNSNVWDGKIFLPNVKYTFAIDLDNNTSYEQFTDMFSIYANHTIWWDISWYKISGGTGVVACDNPPFPCRMARFGINVTSTVESVEESVLTSPILFPEQLTHSISSIIPMILSGFYELDVSAAINTVPNNATFLQFALDPAVGVGKNQTIKTIDYNGDGKNDYYVLAFNIADLDSDGVADGIDPSTLMGLVFDTIGVAPSYEQGETLKYKVENGVIHFGSKKKIQYSIDGVPNIPAYVDKLPLPLMAAGTHRIEIWEVNEHGLYYKPYVYSWVQERIEPVQQPLELYGCAATKKGSVDIFIAVLLVLAGWLLMRENK